MIVTGVPKPEGVISEPAAPWAVSVPKMLTLPEPSDWLLIVRFEPLALFWPTLRSVVSPV